MAICALIFDYYAHPMGMGLCRLGTQICVCFEVCNTENTLLYLGINLD